MPLKSEPLEDPHLNLTPMVDVVLNLVIFFMVGTQFVDRERHYEINLPHVSDAKPLTAGPDEIVVNLSHEGRVYVSGVERSLEEVEKILGDARARFADQAVVVRGDAKVDYQNVMTVLNICQRSGITNLQLANRLEGQ